MTKKAGLSQQQAHQLLSTLGPNSLPVVPPPTNLQLLISQFKSPLVYVLVVAAVVTFLLQDYKDTLIIAIAVIINTTLGFFQEQKASNALQALKKLVQAEVEVLRDGKRKNIPVEEVVPGDVCFLTTGIKIPADGEIIESSRLFVTEATLTGESSPVGKSLKSEVFMGTVVTAGNGVMLVTKTGSQTSMGLIAQQVQTDFDETPLKKQLKLFSGQLTILVISLTTIVFVLGFLLQRPLADMFSISVALAVSTIPEGLLIGLTVVLAIGMQRIVKRKGLVRNLVSAETLGGVTAICIDKTGTLTEGNVAVDEVLGSEKAIIQQALLANDRDDPLVISLWQWATSKATPNDLQQDTVEAFLDSRPRIDSLPFSSENRFFASLHQDKNATILLVNGAPEVLLAASNLSNTKKAEIEAEIKRVTTLGKRVIGMARKKLPSTHTTIRVSDVAKELEWVGLVAFYDPIRPGVKSALEKITKAHITLLVITGDYAQTAVSVLKNLGIPVGQNTVILGEELEKMSEKELSEKLRTTQVLLFARTAPLQKMKIVKALKKNNEVVAMMGDGVNDAPALKQADIGIVVGSATDVAKESADMVLLDSSFATIVAAIEEGRGIFDNIRKIVLYLMADAFQAIITVLGTLLLSLPMPVTAAQILWINIVSDGFPHLALTVDPKIAGTMSKPPRPPKEKIVTKWMRLQILIVSIFGGLVALSLFSYFYFAGELELARSITFAVLGINSLVYVFSIRTLKEPFWKQNMFENTWLNVAVVAGLGFQLLPFATPATRSFFDVVWLDIDHWLLVFCSSLIMFGFIEISKSILRNTSK